MPRDISDITQERKQLKSKIERLGADLKGVMDSLENDGVTDGRVERAENLSRAIMKADEELAEVEREEREFTSDLLDRIKAGPPGMTEGVIVDNETAKARLLGDDGPSDAVTRDTVALKSSQKLTDWGRVHGEAGGSDVTMAGMIRGLQFGVWGPAEEKALKNQGSMVGSEGGFLVPSGLSLQVLDQARNEARVMQAGATTVPMPTPEYTIARVAGDPSTAWRKESSTISESEATFDKLTLHARTLSTLVKIPLELIEDTVGGGGRSVEPLIQNILAEAIALEVDRVALLGDGDDNEPVGLLNTSDVSTSSLAGAPSNWDFIVDRAGVVEDNNFTVTAGITSPRVGRQLGKLKDTTNQPLRRPERVDYTLHETNQVPTDLGGGSDESLLFVGEWPQLIVGVRTGLQLIPLRERFMDSGEIGLIAWFRGDIGVARTGAFAIEDQITA